MRSGIYPLKSFSMTMRLTMPFFIRLISTIRTTFTNLSINPPQMSFLNQFLYRCILNLVINLFFMSRFIICSMCSVINLDIMS